MNGEERSRDEREGDGVDGDNVSGSADVGDGEADAVSEDCGGGMQGEAGGVVPAWNVTNLQRGKLFTYSGMLALWLPRMECTPLYLKMAG
jgi:hypothetical protein